MFFFLLLACSDSNPPKSEPDVDVQKSTESTKQTKAPISNSLSAETTTQNDVMYNQEQAEQPDEKKPSQKSKSSQETEIIPSPDIEGMSKKKKENKIYAEDIDKLVNKEEKKSPQTAASEEVVEVEVEAQYNVHFNDSKSNIIVQVYKDSSAIAASMSHDHVIRARGWEGQVIWKPNEPHNCIFEFQIPVHFFEVDPDKWRKKMNLPGTISKKDKKEIHKNMMSKTQLWAEKYSHINFSAQNCVTKDKGIQLNGEMTIRGVTKEITTIIQITEDEKLSINGSFYLNQTSFGITPYSAFMGAVKNKNKIKISLDLKQ